MTIYGCNDVLIFIKMTQSVTLLLSIYILSLFCASVEGSHIAFLG